MVPLHAVCGDAVTRSHDGMTQLQLESLKQSPHLTRTDLMAHPGCARARQHRAHARQHRAHACRQRAHAHCHRARARQHRHCLLFE